MPFSGSHLVFYLILFWIRKMRFPIWYIFTHPPSWFSESSCNFLPLLQHVWLTCLVPNLNLILCFTLNFNYFQAKAVWTTKFPQPWPGMFSRHALHGIRSGAWLKPTLSNRRLFVNKGFNAGQAPHNFASGSLDSLDSRVWNDHAKFKWNWP